MWRYHCEQQSSLCYRFVQLTDKRFFGLHKGASYTNIAVVRKINKVWAQGPHPLKSVSWSSQTEEKKLLLSKIFSFCHRWQHNSFQVPGYKILEVLLDSEEKLHLVGQPVSFHLSPQDTCLCLQASVWNSLLGKRVALVFPLPNGDCRFLGLWDA